MSTVLYDSPVFGPVHSRRLGISLGVNLMPADGKVCDFDCVYCECGFNKDHVTHSPRPTRLQVAEALEKRLMEMKYCPQTKVSVLSNATMLDKPGVHAALMRVDNNIQKLDTVNAAYIQKVDRPTQSTYRVARVIENLKSFHGRVIVQTMFLKGTVNGEDVDNTGDEYVKPWLRALVDIQPRQVMVYTIDRETPDKDLRKATPEELDAISDKVRELGIMCETSY